MDEYLDLLQSINLYEEEIRILRDKIRGEKLVLIEKIIENGDIDLLSVNVKRIYQIDRMNEKNINKMKDKK